MFNRPLVAIGLAMIFLAPGLARATEPTDFVIMKVRLDQVMQPKSAIDAINECANNEACRAVLGAGAGYLGINSVHLSAVAGIITRAEKIGEEGHFTYELPSGYQYCRSSLSTISVVPPEGNRASVMSVSSHRTGVSVYTWTPRQSWGGGRSWVEADFTIYGVRDRVANTMRDNGRCRAYGRPLTDCAGARGVNGGRPACGAVED